MLCRGFPGISTFTLIQGVMALTSYEGWVVGLAALMSQSWADMDDLPSRRQWKQLGCMGKLKSSHKGTADCNGHGGSSLTCHMISCSSGPSSRICWMTGCLRAKASRASWGMEGSTQRQRAVKVGLAEQHYVLYYSRLLLSHVFVLWKLNRRQMLWVESLRGECSVVT